MLKIVKYAETEVIEKHVYTCDICGKEMSRFRECLMCKRHICKECLVYEWDNSDYPDIYCKSCWKIGEPFRKQIEIEEEKHDKLEEQLYADWKIVALKRIKENDINE